MADTGFQILESLRSLGVKVRIARLGRLSLEPASKIPAEMVPRIREAKPAILEALRTCLVACGSSHCAGCYEVAPGVRIHPPKCGEDYRAWLERWEAKSKVQ
jgi:hypothetical protein